MPSWSNRTWGEVVTLQRGYDITKREQNLRGSVPVISSGGLSSFHDQALAQGPGVIMGRKGTLGRVYFVEGPYWPHDTTLWVKDFKGNDPRFVYYALKNLDISHLNVGTASPTLNRNHVHPISVLWPDSLDEQRAIAATLGALDDKIDSNRRATGLLRELAVAHLRAAASGRRVVADVAEIRKGLSYKGANLVSEGEGMPMVNMGNAENFGWLKRSGFKFYDGETKSKHHVAGGSLLVTGVEQTWKHEIIGWPLLVPEDVDGALFTHHMLLVDFAPHNEWMRLPLWAFLYTPEARAILEGSVYGTTVATLPVATLGTLEFSIPNHDSPSIPAAESMLRRAWGLERESQALANTRDTLLPAILSGKIRVMEAVV